MIRTQQNYEFSNEIINLLNKLSSSFEYYLPDEKISAVWQETEVISTEYPDFEAVYFERELDGALIYISEEFEFFPLYIMYLVTKNGKPNISIQGTFLGSELIGIDKGSQVLVIGFSNPETIDKMMEYIPPTEENTEIGMEYLNDLALGYIEDII